MGGLSANEGGVVDIVFADSHTLWAQHSSGTFSQLDLPQVYKPIDAIPRTSVTWEASFAILSARKSCWEVRLTIFIRISDKVEARQLRGSKQKPKGYMFEGTD
ncbi:hypothetical protein PILCRDRAFT_816306 [Piloderma croceum F 1598]|uniref:Uncharacterized protein n=1 Tax=Piloderma croceum (strain F 1598) TaxID=765440 RepID=A0A0C3G6U2_PILCF|nr:hypothetical protein PILCRDRAFT_816306 [Piloderma croceum F 1598]